MLPKSLSDYTDFPYKEPTSLLMKGIDMVEILKLEWLIGFVERAIWVNSVYFLYLLLLSLFIILDSSKPA
jgi:hypothetical protein